MIEFSFPNASLEERYPERLELRTNEKRHGLKEQGIQIRW